MGLTQKATASVYGGSGVKSGAGLGGIIGNGDPKSTVFYILNTFLSYAALAATVAIIIAGIYIIFSGFNDDNRETAKKIIYYAIAGLIVIALATSIVKLTESIVR